PSRPGGTPTTVVAVADHQAAVEHNRIIAPAHNRQPGAGAHREERAGPAVAGGAVGADNSIGAAHHRCDVGRSEYVIALGITRAAAFTDPVSQLLQLRGDPDSPLCTAKVIDLRNSAGSIRS